MRTWAPLWSGIVNSSLWDEPDHVVKVFMTMLAIKDMDHIVRASAYEIGRMSRKSETEVLDAMKILSSPDSKRVEKQEHEGRRIQLVEEGWLILNGGKYHELVRTEMARWRNRKAQAVFREKQKRIEEAKRLNAQYPAKLNGSKTEQKQVQEWADGIRPDERLGE